MNPFTEPPAVDEARAQRTNIIQSAQPPSEREQTALNAALFERTRADKLELAIRRALLHLGRRERLNAQLELQNALFKMNIFVNKNQKITAIQGQCVYEMDVNLSDAFAIVETWLRGTHKPDPSDHIGDESRSRAAKAIEALILCNCTVGHRSELQANDDPRMRLLNQNVNPSGRAGSSQWAICR